MILRILIIFFLFTLTTQAQEIPQLATNGIFDKKSILKEIKKKIKKSKKKNFQASYSESNNGDTVVFFMKEKVEGLTVKYVFNIPPLNSHSAKFCGIQEYYFDCSPCANEYLDQIINSCGLRKLSEQKYLSNYFNQTELEVVNNNEKNACIVLKCRFVDKKREEYETLYNSLKGE